jgi:hypothetical protein
MTDVITILAVFTRHWKQHIMTINPKVTYFSGIIFHEHPHSFPYIKHDDAIIESGTSILFEITCSFMRFLTRASK